MSLVTPSSIHGEANHVVSGAQLSSPTTGSPEPGSPWMELGVTRDTAGPSTAPDPSTAPAQAQLPLVRGRQPPPARATQPQLPLAQA